METIRYEVAAGVATLTLNRPAQRNAIDLQMRDEIALCLAALKRDRECARSCSPAPAAHSARAATCAASGRRSSMAPAGALA